METDKIDKKDKELATSPRQAFREAVCTECKDFTENKGLCSGCVDDIIKCIKIIEFGDEFIPLPDYAGSVTCPPGNCQCQVRS